MAKRGYKLQEFVAHSAGVNCLSIGKKTSRLFITGGDDHKVNLWTIGKPNSLMSLCGHTSPVETVTFNSEEVLVLGGASTGVIKLWDLEEVKMVRTLTGHRSNCTAVEFHPFGEFFASGSMDTNLKIWDIRKKGCIHTYKGHTRGISTIKFTPDGRWVVSGGFDNVVKVWDLTAGKLLHDFKFHEGHIRAIDFHPLEFLLATGSADRTVKFWDLETFELIGSVRPEATGVRAITFHPDGRTLFSGVEDGLKVYSWEPVICHDSVDMGWSTLGDLCIHDGKLLACSYYRNSIGVWAADISRIEPYGASTAHEQKDCTEQKINLNFQGSQSSEKVGSGVRSTLGQRCMSPDYETKEIKNIYIDSTGGKPVASKRMDSTYLKDEPASDSKEISCQPAQKQNPLVGLNARSEEKTLGESFFVPSVVPRDSPDGKDGADSGKESITFSRTKRGMLLKPAHARRSSTSKIEVEKWPEVVESQTPSKLDGPLCSNFRSKLTSEDRPGESLESNIKGDAEKSEKNLLTQTPSNQEKCDESLNCSKGTSSVKIVNGVAIIHGRTRSLVERFERRERINCNEDQASTVSHVIPEMDKTPTIPVQVLHRERFDINEYEPSTVSHMIPEIEKTHATPSRVSHREGFSSNEDQASTAPHTIPEIDKTHTMPVKASHRERFNSNEDQASTVPHMIPEMDKTHTMPVKASHKERFNSNEDQASTVPHMIPEVDKTHTTPVKVSRRERFNSKKDQAYIVSHVIPEIDKSPTMPVKVLHRERFNSNKDQASVVSHVIPEMDKSPTMPVKVLHRERFNSNKDQASVVSRVIPEIDKTPTIPVKGLHRERFNSNKDQASTVPRVIPEMDKTPTMLKGEPQTSERDSTPADHMDVTEDLMHTHELFLSTLRSRLTKLQVVRHFWEQNDFKGAISALRKLPDHAVQADVISVLMEKMDILTLDLFSCMLPVLLGLLDSKVERHTSVSLEMLLKLTAVFGPVIRSTISAPPPVGVNLQAEQRLECCNQCFIQLQKIQKVLPALIRKGGLLAKCARELNLVLQES